MSLSEEEIARLQVAADKYDQYKESASVKERADWVIDTVADLIRDGNEEALRPGIVGEHGEDAWRKLRNLALDRLVERDEYDEGLELPADPSIQGMGRFNPSQAVRAGKVTPRQGELMRQLDALDGDDATDVLIDLVADAIREGNEETFRVAVEEADGDWDLLRKKALERVIGQLKDVQESERPQDKLTGKELAEFNRYWNSGAYQKRMREMVRSGEMTMVDQETGEPADIDPDTLEFTRDGDDVTIRARARDGSPTRPLRMEERPARVGVRIEVHPDAIWEGAPVIARTPDGRQFLVAGLGHAQEAKKSGDEELEAYVVDYDLEDGPDGLIGKLRASTEEIARENPDQLRFQGEWKTLHPAHIGDEPTKTPVPERFARRMFLARDGVLPCERCGSYERDDEHDRIAIVKYARPMPVNEMDRRAKADGQRLVRICARCAMTDPEKHYGLIWRGQVPPTPRRCPRCAETWIPTNKHPGEYMGAMSRVRVGGPGKPGYATRNVEICSACGQDEAMGRGLVPIEEWPIGIDASPRSFYDEEHQEQIRARFDEMEDAGVEAEAER